LTTEENEAKYPLTDVSSDGAMIIGAGFDLQGCAGFKPGTEPLEFIYKARDHDCLTTRSATPQGRQDVTSALSLTDFDKICT